MFNKSIAVIIPCFNEEKAIGQTIESFRQFLPTAKIYIFNNNSTDNTEGIARAHGAEVYKEMYQGKGNVVKRMFAEINADIYLMTDGDATYDAAAAPLLIKTLVDSHLDMVVGIRKTVDDTEKTYRKGHKIGNKMFNILLRLLFKNSPFRDILSGYRVFSKRFVKSFPAISSGFEIEAELSIHALQMKLPCAEVETNYYERPIGSVSKLKTYSDGLKILKMIIVLFKEVQPLKFFSLVSLLFIALAFCLGIPLLHHYLLTGLVPRFPTAILASALTIIGFLSLLSGIILEDIAKLRLEAKLLAYLQIQI